jgi:dihydroorotate dehydrogenase electron transfer subunit
MGSSQYRLATLAENLVLSGDSFVLRFEGCDFLARARPGQFVMLRGEDWGSDPILPRAFSLLEVTPGGRAEILAKAAGKASGLLQRALPGARFSLLGPLGNGFADPTGDRDQWLVAGGVGLAPLYMLARRAAAFGVAHRMTMFYGGRTADDLVLLERVAATGAELMLATENGSRGQRGFVTAALEAALDRRPVASDSPLLVACGPDSMLEAVAHIARTRRLDCLLSLEGEMACGIGACLACAVPCRGSRPFRYGCVDGPVFDLADLAEHYGDASRLAGEAGEAGEGR